MFDSNLLSVEVIGAVASFVAGLLSFIPALGKTSARRALTAIAALIVAVIISDKASFDSWQVFGETLFRAAVYSVASYKLVFQPLVLPKVAKTIGSKVQVN